MKLKFATVITANNPFRPEKDREVLEVPAGFTIANWVKNNPNLLDSPMVCIVDGAPTLRSEWDDFVVSEGMIVVFQKIPQGGVGNLFKSALGLGLGVSYGIAGVAPANFVRKTVRKLRNLLNPPEIPSPDQAKELAAPSPTYSLNAQGNTARMGSAIPSLYGRHIIFPDFSTKPYSEFIDNSQYLNHILCIGQGNYTIEGIYIDDTDMEEFSGITSNVVLHAGSDTPAGFPENVVTCVEVSGQEIFAPNDGGLSWVGPFIINPANTIATHFNFDVTYPQGLYSAADDGSLNYTTLSYIVHVRKVDASGAPVDGVWHHVLSSSLTSNENRVIRKTLGFSPPDGEGRYEMRMQRTSNKYFSPRIANVVMWTGAKATIKSTNDFGNITRLSLTMRATSNLSDRASRKVSCVVQRLLPTWNPTNGWGETENDDGEMIIPKIATRSACWAIVDMLKAEYGAKLTDDRIDLLGIYEIDQIVSSRGDEFNAVYDRKMSLWEAVRLAARSIRCAPVLQGGIFRLIRDRPQTLPVAMFTNRNIIKGSFKITHTLQDFAEDTSDGVKLEYIDESTWKPAEVAFTPTPYETPEPDEIISPPETPIDMKLFGCTNTAQATRECKYLARNEALRATTIEFSTELEGFIPTFGDLIVVTTDMPTWGVSGDVVSVDSEGYIKLSEPVTFEEGSDYVIAFRTKNGGVSGPWEVVKGRDDAEVKFEDDYPITTYSDGANVTVSSSETLRIYFGLEAERTHFAFGTASTIYRRAVIKNITPNRNGTVKIVAIVEDDRVHTD